MSTKPLRYHGGWNIKGDISRTQLVVELIAVLSGCASHYVDEPLKLHGLADQDVCHGCLEENAARQAAGGIIDLCDMLSNLPAAKRCFWVGEGPR